MSSYLCAIPCYNEAINLEALFRDIDENNIRDHFDLIFVDDGSSDQTRNMIEEKGYPVISHKKNMGYGESVKTAFRYALKETYDYMAIFPGDHQRSASDLLQLKQKLIDDNLDAIAGSKFHIYSKKYGPIGRRIGNRMFSFMAKYGWNAPFKDVLSGFKIYKINAVKEFLPGLPGNYGFDITFSYMASQFDLKTAAIPVDCKYTKHTTKMKSIILTSIMMMLTLCFFISKHRISHFLYRKYDDTSMATNRSSIYLSAMLASVPGIIFFLINFYWFGLIQWLSIGPLKTFLYILSAFSLTVLAGIFIILYLRKKSDLIRKISGLSILALIIIGTAPLKQIRPPDGDAPHYLTAAVSLAEDFDLLTDRNYDEKAYMRFFRQNAESWDLPDRRQDKNINGEIQFWPSIGVPLIAAPFALIFPSMSFTLFVSLLIFLALAVLWQFGEHSGSVNIWKILLYAACPVIAFTNQFFPDPLAFCFFAFALADAIILKKYTRSCIWLAFLPWLKPYFGVFSFALYISVIITRHIKIDQVIKMSVIPIFSVFGLMLYNMNSWNGNGFLSYILGDVYHSTLQHFSAEDYFARFAQMIFGTKSGIFWSFPAIILVLMPKYKRTPFPACLIPVFMIASIFLMMLPSYEGIDGSWGPRARLLLPFLPLVLLSFDRIVFSIKVRFLIFMSFILSLPAYLFSIGSLPWSDLSNPFGIITYYVNLRWWSEHVPTVSKMMDMIGAYSYSIAYALLVTTILINIWYWGKSVRYLSLFRKKIPHVQNGNRNRIAEGTESRSSY
ncbi:MAG: glycosyltransferase family 2 protein [Deltaproteobacteria bacterium]|nr:glycosyltransferase family 2 protein [Deltaproteobacteria bacterium]